MVNPTKTNFDETIRKLREGTVRRLREGVQGGRDPEQSSPPARFELSRDDKGREFAVPILTVREERLNSWIWVCAHFDYGESVNDETVLTPYQAKVGKELSLGQKNGLIFGPPSTGKTTAAVWALRELHLSGRSVKAARFLQFKTQMEPAFCDEHGFSPDSVSRWYAEPDFLLLDEVGYGDTRQTIREHERRIFFDLISVRDSMKRKTWICSNVDRNELHKLYGEAALSRLDGAGRCLVADFSREKNLRY